MNQAKVYQLLKKTDLFNARWYKATYQDVNLSGMDPINHFLKYGAKLGRNPSKKFDTNFYRKQVIEDLEENDNPLVHYLIKGKHNQRLRINSSEPTFEEEELRQRVVGHLWGGTR